MFPPARTQTRDYASTARNNSSSPSLESQATRTTTSSGRSRRTIAKVKSLGARLKLWKKPKTAGDADSLMADDSDRRERRSWHQQALQHLAAFDNPNPFFHVGWWSPSPGSPSRLLGASF